MLGEPECVVETVEVRHRVGLELPVLEAVGQKDTVGVVVDVRHKLGVPDRVVETEREKVAEGDTECVVVTLEVKHRLELELEDLDALGQ